jgi:hypothetical protein
MFHASGVTKARRVNDRDGEWNGKSRLPQELISRDKVRLADGLIRFGLRGNSFVLFCDNFETEWISPPNPEEPIYDSIEKCRLARLGPPNDQNPKFILCDSLIWRDYDQSNSPLAICCDYMVWRLEDWWTI